MEAGAYAIKVRRARAKRARGAASADGRRFGTSRDAVLYRSGFVAASLLCSRHRAAFAEHHGNRVAMDTRERRKNNAKSSSVLKRELTQDQILALAELEKYGWELKF